MRSKKRNQRREHRRADLCLLPRPKPALRDGLSATHQSGTQVPQRLLTRLRRGRLRLARLWCVRVADSHSCGTVELRRPHFAPGILAPLRSRPSASFRAAQIIDDLPGRLSRSRSGRAELSCFVRPPPGDSELDPCSASVAAPGRLAPAKFDDASSLPLAARSVGAGPGWGRRKGVPQLWVFAGLHEGYFNPSVDLQCFLGLSG